MRLHLANSSQRWLFSDSEGLGVEHVGKTRLVLVMALLCMAVACRESHIDSSSEKAFNDSLMTMYGDHSVSEAQDFGRRLVAAQDALGKDAVRKALHAKNWAEANAYLNQATAHLAPPRSPDPAKG